MKPGVGKKNRDKMPGAEELPDFFQFLAQCLSHGGTQGYVKGLGP